MFAGSRPVSRTHLAQGMMRHGEEPFMTRAHIITGSFGAGKTTAIRWLMAQKPRDELWVVVLNEFTDAGIDALSVAQSAQGDYDVRLVSGGCLCCIGELEFGRQLREILRNLRPLRLIIEPSGAGHAADIVDELAKYEAQGAMQLDSVVCLVDARDAAPMLERRDDSAWSQVQSADVLLMSKADVAQAGDREAFLAIAAAQFPRKSYVGDCVNGVLPPQAMLQYARLPRFSLLEELPTRTSANTLPFPILGLAGSETQVNHLGLWAASWVLPRELTFSRVALEPRLEWLIDAYRTALRRFKAVFRTGPGPSWLIQSHGSGISGEDSAYRRDSRLEIVLTVAPTERFLDEWRSLLRDAALTPRA